MNKDVKILILGGNGFIGKELGTALLEKGYVNITTTSRRERQSSDIKSKHISGVEIMKPETLEKPIAEADVVINLAGFISFAQKDRKKLLQVNGKGALNVLHACEKNKKLYRLIHLSSTASFGFSSQIIDESFCFNWSSHKNLVYSYSKFIANQAIENSTVPTNIIYPCLVLGSGGSENVRNLLKYARNKKNLLVTPGQNSIIDVRDLAASIVTVLEKSPSKENYISCGESVSFSDFFRVISETFGQKTKIRTLPLWMYFPLLLIAQVSETFGSKKIGYEQIALGFQKRNHSNKKLKNLGYVPKYSLRQTLADILSEESI